jgi:hypothetical protein
MSNLILHDYLRDTIVSTYKGCIYCKSRTQFTCVRCGYCYSCHWKREELDRVQLEIAKSVNLRKDSHAATIIIEQPPSRPHQRPQQQTKVIDVYGRETEPICSYRKCHHKFSVHGHGNNHNCKCRHAMNYATGISILPLTKIEVL